MNEVWKDIIGHEGYYQISNFGRIKSLSRFVKRAGNKNDMVLKEKLLKIQIPPVGRSYSELMNTNKKHRTKISIDRTVAKYFLPNTKNATWVKHKDDNIYNNIVTNLEWVNPRERKTEDYNLETELNKSKDVLTEDLAYIAGIMDADGCFTININRGKRHIAYVPFIQIGQIDQEAIDFVKERFEFNKYIEKTNQTKVTGSNYIPKPFYRIVMAGVRTEAFLIRIYPYLKIKQKQAKCLLELCEMLKNPEMIKTPTKVIRQNTTYIANFPIRSKNHIKRQHALYQKVGKYNRRENEDKI